MIYDYDADPQQGDMPYDQAERAEQPECLCDVLPADWTALPGHARACPAAEVPR